jgi:hypothetical protein
MFQQDYFNHYIPDLLKQMHYFDNTLYIVMKTILFLLFFIISLYSFSQSTKVITIKPGDNFAKEELVKEIYRYPEFTNGVVYFKNGGKATGRINYHRIYKELAFITGKGDTLLLENPGSINFITVSNDTFYYSGIYVEQISRAAQIKLAENVQIAETDRKRKGTYGEELIGPTSISFFTMQNYTQKLSNNETITFTKKTSFFIGDEANLFVVANKKNLLKLLTKQKGEAVEEFLKQKEINFEKREDLLALFSFLQTLN